MQKISPFLWFDNNAEDAMKLYTSVFKNAKILSETHYVEGGPGPAGTLMTAAIELEGQHFTLLNGGPQYKFTEAISFVVDCTTQEEVDYYWEKLTANGGEEGPCGWLKDQFGVSWQIVPRALPELMNDPNPAKAQKVVQAMLQMKKIEIAKLQEAYDQA